jgi:hypothetical protein
MQKMLEPSATSQSLGSEPDSASNAESSNTEPSSTESAASIKSGKSNQSNNSSSGQASAGQTKPLPYKENHQVELLNLQAETEALLQQLHLLSHQRRAEDDTAIDEAKRQIVQQQRALQPSSH